MWLFVQDLSQLKAVYPRWQSFMANAIRQFFGTADYDTARTIGDSLGQHTISFPDQQRVAPDRVEPQAREFIGRDR